jgi:hypothetical protein
VLFIELSRYRDREEMGGVYLTSQLDRTYNFVRDGRYSGRGWVCSASPPSPARLIFHHVGMYSKKWPLPLCVFMISFD